MTAVPSPSAKQQFLGNDGKPLVGGQLFTYAGGTSTKLATYKNSGGVDENTNPVILDFRGECDLWMPPNVAYKFVLAPRDDTDPPARPIWSVDDIESAQLITLYGGVDTGIADSYLLTFNANFDAYEDGIVIYWVAAHTNTGASVVNVNGLGPVSILNQSGAELEAGQIQAGQVQQMMFFDGAFQTLIPNFQSSRNHWTAGNSDAFVQLVDSPTTVIDCAAGNAFSWTIEGNRTVLFDNEVDGSWVDLYITQGGVGGFEPVWPANTVWTGGTAPDLSETPGEMDLVSLRYELATDTWYASLAVDKPRLFDSPAFTGIPTAPTPAPGTSDDQIATTAFVLSSADFSTDGYWIGPGGFTVQWGTRSFGSGAQTVNFPTEFDSACLGVSLTIRRNGSPSGQAHVVQGNPSTTSFVMRFAAESDGVFWLAWGF